MFHVVLYEPEIPPNTGNIIRLCANTGFHLHLVGKLGFDMDDKQLRRAGLDYPEWARVEQHLDWPAFIESIAPPRIFLFSTRGKRNYADCRFEAGDALVFGPETRGLPQAMLDEHGSEHCLRLPMQEHSRSLNLSNTVAIVVYEAWRQQGFGGAA